MENNEIMNYDEMEVMDDEIVTEEKAGIGTGVAMLIGAGLTIAVGAVVKLAKKGIENIKAKKAAQKSDEVCGEDQETDEAVGE